MATFRRTDAPIPNIADDPGLAADAALLRQLNAAFDDLDARRKILKLQGFLRDNPDANHALEIRLQITRLLEQLLPAAALPSSPPRATEPTTALARGIAILNGEPLPVAETDEARLKEFDLRLERLNEAINEQQAIVDDGAQRFSREAAKAVQPAHDALQLKLFEAAQTLARLNREAMELDGKVLAAGIRGSDLLLPCPSAIPTLLGLESDWNSEIRRWGREAEKRGIIK